MAVLASAGSLNESVADNRMSVSFTLDGPSLFRSQPLLLSQDWASLAKVTGLGEALTCASRSSWGEKSQGL